jgi:hypothetical protein
LPQLIDDLAFEASGAPVALLEIAMSLKNAALLALCGSVLVTALLVMSLIWNLLSVLRGLSPAASLFASIIYAFAGLTTALFFYTFHAKQP